MFALFLKSLRLHFVWWLQSLWPGRHIGAPLGLRRLLFLLLGYPLFLALQCLHWLGFLLDEIFFRGYRTAPLQEPVFVIGIPRSGTTFLHRTLANDRQRFTSFSTWEAILAPSVTGRKTLRALAAVDRALGSPCRRIIDRLVQGTTGDFNDIHTVDLSAPEEDYLSLLPVGGCFILLLAFPFARELRQLGRLQTMPQQARSQLLDFYRRLLQRHLYCHPEKQLLSKNAAFASWGESLKTTFPDAKFLVCVREPVSALSSQLSSLAPARAAFGTDPEGSHTATLFTEMYADYYANLAKFVANCPPQQVAVIEQDDLKKAPGATITAALAKVALDHSPALDEALATLHPAAPSGHRHRPEDFSLDRAQIGRCMCPDYEAMLNSLHRSQPNPN